MSPSSLLLAALSVVLPLVLAVAPCQATTWDVPGDAPTIQAGIDLASVGDTVLVAPGTYTGDGNRDIDFHGKDVVLLSEAGPEATTIDAEGTTSITRRGFFIHSGETGAARIDGFTVTGGRCHDPLRAGGGIWCESSSPTVSNCVFTLNWAGDSEPIGPSKQASGMLGCGSGGAIFLWFSSAKFFDCTITANGATCGPGGGVWVLDSPDATFSECLISNNVAGGVLLLRSTGTFTNCTIAGNAAGGYAIEAAGGASAALERCVIWGNCGNLLASQGTGSIQVTCSVLDSTGNGGLENIVFNAGNVFANPLFCDADLCPDPWPPTHVDFRVGPQSPCLPANNPCGLLIGAREVCAATSVPTSPGTFVLSVFPNPSVSVTQMRYSLAEDAAARLTIFDVGGRRIHTFDLQGSAGSLSWDGRDAAGRGTPPGIYFLRLEAGDRIETQRFTRLR